MYVCICVAVSDKDIRELVAKGTCTAAEVMARTGAGSRCGTCRADVVALVEGSSANPALKAESSSSREPVDEPSCGVRRLHLLRRASSAA